MTWIAIPLVACSGLLAAATCRTAAPDAGSATDKPNIVLILSDDQNYTDFGFMGNRHVQTPNLDRLAAQSARYVNGYVPSSVCSPSLATILTGLYPHKHGIHYNHPPPGNAAFNRMTSADEYVRVRSRSFSLIRAVDTLPRLLSQRSGYRCLQTGKFWEGHFSNGGFTDGMTLFKAVPGQTFGGNRKLAGGELVAHGNGDAGLAIGRVTMQPIFDFLEAHGDRPFLIWYAPYLPHQPHDSPQKYYDLYEGRPDVPEHCIPYYASISRFDETVGRLVRYIEQKGLAKNTLFVFVVDNGWEPSTRRAKHRSQEFDHTRRSKRAPFDYGLRTPILIRWDGRVRPATHEALVSSIDIVPTLLAATGHADKAKSLPGVNLLPSATGSEKLDPDRAVFGEIYPGDASALGNPSRDVAYRWVRKGDFKLIVTHSHNTKKQRKSLGCPKSQGFDTGVRSRAGAWGGYLSGDALFNVVADPDESKNLIADTHYAGQVAELRRLLDRWWTPRDDPPTVKPGPVQP